MKRQNFTLLMFLAIILTVQSAYGQFKQLPQKIREDFCTNAYFNYKYGSDAFKAYMTISARNIGLNSIIDIEIAVEKICENSKLQDEFFQNVLRIGGGRDFIFQQFHSIGMTAVNAKTLTDYLIDNENSRQQTYSQNEIAKTKKTDVNQKVVKNNEITGYPIEIYNPQPLSDNPTLDILKWNVQEIDDLLSLDKSFELPITIAKIQTVLKVEPNIEEDEYFDDKIFSWTLPSGIILTAMNAQETDIGWLTGWLIIEAEDGKIVKGLPYDLIINESSLKSVETKLSNIKTQKLGNHIEFRKGNQEYRFEFNENKTLEKVHISLN